MVTQAFRSTVGIVWLTLLLSWVWAAGAQPIITAPRPSSTNQPDPLAAFMVSQPPIDTTSPITPKAGFDPDVITNGQASVYRVTLNVMEQSVDWPDSIPTPDHCTIRKGASGQFLQNLGGIIVPKTTFLYHVQPQSNGTFTLPGYSVRARGETVQIPEATLTVVPPGSRAVEVAPRIQLHANGTEFFVGQSAELQVQFPGKPDGTAQMLSQVDVVGDGLIVDRDYRTQRLEVHVQNGVSRPTFIYDALVTPLRPGPIEVTAQGYISGRLAQGPIVISGPVTIRGGQPTYTLVDSDPMTLHILPLPRSSELPGFTGAIGSFTVDSPKLSTNRVQAGDLITLSLTVRGKGNLERVLPPVIENQPQWQVFQPKKENTLPAIIRQRRFVTFEYQLIPLDDTIEATPPIPFSYFDPGSRSYVDLSVPPVPITVDPSASRALATGQTSVIEARSFLRELLKKPEEPQALADTLESQGRTAKTLEPAHEQIGFFGFQVIPAALLGGLWYWDRRRRYFEDHPEVLVQRRARKAIRWHARHARKAARHGNPREFLHHAIQGFRQACGPAVPANPHALVCDDILNALPREARRDRINGMIRKLFATENEWRFGEVPPEGRELLGLAGEVDQRLEELRNAI